ncbi:hypothetical protein DUI87_10074 [Hirundo rustica rustica]|uniref:Uncharacterized protein n=1 Tax=Hirundo rustica rustica TaxID=333673 RepID=A0A3M0KMT2_HIRRU|nr:hypothetical protein DUI87_10074 [Hirundo rustica rustica]
MHLVELPPWSILSHSLTGGDMPQAQERGMVHLDMVGEQDWAAGTGAACWLDREVVELEEKLKLGFILLLRQGEYYACGCDLISSLKSKLTSKLTSTALGEEPSPTGP